MISIARLKAAGCRVDGLTWDVQENPIFVTTNANGAWTDDQKNAVLKILGKIPPTVSPEGLCQTVDAFRDQRLENGYTDSTTGKIYQCDEISVSRWTALAMQCYIAIAIQTSGGVVAPDVTIITADNSQTTLTASEAYDLFSNRVAPWVQATIFFARTMKNNILAGNPPTDITVGWP